MVRKALRRAANGRRRLCVIAGGAYAVKTLLLDDDDGAKAPAGPTLEVRVLRPGTFAGAHPYAPYYVVPLKRFKDPSELTRLARNKLVSKPESALSKGALAGSPQIVRLSLRATSDDPVTVDGRALRGRQRCAAAARLVHGAGRLHGHAGAARAKLSLDSRRGTRALRRRRRRERADARARGRSRRAAGARAAGLDDAPPGRLDRRARRCATRTVAGSTIVVDDGGKPFRVTSARSSQAYRPIYGASGIIGYARQRGFEDC